jgi:hypothetical protein
MGQLFPVLTLPPLHCYCPWHALRYVEIGDPSPRYPGQLKHLRTLAGARRRWAGVGPLIGTRAGGLLFVLLLQLAEFSPTLVLLGLRGIGIFITLQPESKPIRDTLRRRNRCQTRVKISGFQEMCDKFEAGDCAGVLREFRDLATGS